MKLEKMKIKKIKKTKHIVIKKETQIWYKNKLKSNVKR
jgi:hypothetical protein